MTLNELREMRLDGRVLVDELGWPQPIALNVMPKPVYGTIRVTDASDFDYRPLIGLDVNVHFATEYHRAAECALRADKVARAVFMCHEPTSKSFFLSRWQTLASNPKQRLTEWLRLLANSALTCANT